MKAAIYIHVPWCRRRCPYCDFYVVVGKPHKEFINGIISEWRSRKDDYAKEPGDSLYFGGGTPSLLEPKVISEIANFFHSSDALAPDAEITIEANPEDIDRTFAEKLAKTPVNRVSLGAQSLNDVVLRSLGRKHSAKTVNSALHLLKEAGFDNISVDLILGATKENRQETQESLYHLVQGDIPHLSTYLLTIEENTKFDHLIRDGRMEKPNEDKQVELYRMAQDVLGQVGYQQYDISSFAKPNFMSRHNQTYWAGGNYIGLGPRAHSMRMLSDGSVERVQNTADLSQWLLGIRQPASERLDQRAALRESLAFGLRNMAKGIYPQDLALRHQINLPESFFSVTEEFLSLGWMDHVQGSFRITQLGALFADSIMREILTLKEE